MPELRKRRSHLALLGVFAMVASVLAVGAPSAVAEAGKPEATAKYSACVGPATVDAGFTDVATGSTHDAAVNCIAYYGITKGTTATTFAPNQSISRWQLAVMLQRAAGPAGVTLPDAKDMGFTDISEMSDSFQGAINQMAELGVMAGTTATTFDPSGTVSRAVIVEALAGFLTSARVGPGGRALSRGVDRSLTVKETAAANADSIPIDETFRDLGGVTYSTYQAVRALAEMGVVQGRGDNTFGPAASVTRAQASAFITRALAHTNARPAGLTMQSGTDTRATTAVTTATDFDLSISLRGEDFAPIDSAGVDIFMYPARNAESAFKQDGTCNESTGGVTSAGVGGNAVCTIELDDEVTEPDGNILVAPGTISESTVFWAWSGDQGAKLDWDVTPKVSMDNSAVSNAASVTLTTVTQPAKALVSTSVSSDAEDDKTVRYGTTVTVTIQLVDANGAAIGVAGRTYSWDATGEHDPVTSVLAGTGTRTTTTDADGKATFTLTQADPVTDRTASNNNNKTTWTYRITPVTPDGQPTIPLEANTDIGFSVGAGGTGSGSIIFDDDDPRTLAVTIELQRKWTRKPVQGTARVGVTGKVTDQYGNPRRGQAIYFDLDGNGQFGCGDDDCTTPDTTIDTANRNVIGGTTRRVTRTNGTNSVSATWAGSNDIIASQYRVGADFTGAADGGPDGDVDDPGEQASMYHFWTEAPAGFNAETGSAVITTSDPADTGLGHGDLLVADLDNNTLVHISAWNAAGGARGGDTAYRDYAYTDSTLFKWFVADLAATIADDEDAAADDNKTPARELIRWLTTAEFEARMAAHVKARGAGNIDSGNLGAALGIASYNTKSGQTIMSIRLVGSENVDAAARATENQALLRDPNPAG